MRGMRLVGRRRRPVGCDLPLEEEKGEDGLDERELGLQNLLLVRIGYGDL